MKQYFLSYSYQLQDFEKIRNEIVKPRKYDNINSLVYLENGLILNTTNDGRYYDKFANRWQAVEVTEDDDNFEIIGFIER